MGDRKKRPARIGLVAVLGLALASSSSLWAQGITLPPSGDNQRSTVIQHIGPVEVRIDYSSPDVTGPNGEDRRGRIWGQLVPWGMVDPGFGNGEPSPWRAGANENTVLSVSHDVLVEGEPLPAGSYGLHVVPAEEGDWTVIFSTDSTSWGSFFYDAAKDALRVDVGPEAAPYHEWLSYDFVDRQPDRATVALHWEELALPFTIEVPQIEEVYLDLIRQELQNAPGFTWQNWVAAAQYCVTQDTNLEQALEWADVAVSRPFVGQENFTTLRTKSQVLTALGRAEEAAEVRTAALGHPTADVLQIHTWARQLQAQGETGQAIEIFKANADLHGETWPTHVGLARAYSAEGDYEKALAHARRAWEQAPDPGNKNNLAQAIELLEEGRDFNPTN